MYNKLAYEAYEELKNENETYLLDVRTIMEWSSRPAIKNIIFIQWRKGKFMEINKEFLAEVEKKIPNKDAKIFVLCKAGQRSKEAGEFLEQNGYKNIYNIIDGYEGFGDQKTGWRYSKLPYKV